MKKWLCILLAVAAVAPVAVWAESDEGEDQKSPGSNEYDKLLIKNRASKFKETGGKSASGDLYIYVDDKQVQEQLKDLRKTPVRERKDLDIGSPLLKKDDKVKNVNIVVDLKRDTTINTQVVGGRGTEVNIAKPELEKGTKAPRSINSIIDVQRGLKVE